MKSFLRFEYYGDYGEREIPKSADPAIQRSGADWPLWEVFIRSKQGLDHKHVGSLHAADAAWPLKMPVMCIPAEGRRKHLGGGK